jgi:hypothetical protein
LTALANLLEDKLEDMAEGSARGLNTMYWLDGTQDAKLVPGVKSFIVDNPTAGILVGGIDQAVNSWWRNRANLAINLGATPADNNLINFLQSEMRLLRKFASGTPKWIVLAGSSFLDQLERELRAKGSYTLDGWAKGGGIDISMADVEFKGLKFEYDPTLDDIGEAKRAYLIDTASIMPMFMTGEFMKKHNPARPEDQYVMYRAMTLTGGLVCRQRNTSGVYGFA